MSRAVVAGGGIAGLIAARRLVDQGREVTLVERDASCGGLLGSFTDSGGTIFDHGAHVLSETGDSELDAVLTRGLDETWRSFHVLRAGNWFGGRMNRESPFPDVRALGPEAAERALRELGTAATLQYDAAPRTLAEAFRANAHAPRGRCVPARTVDRNTVATDPQPPGVML